MKEKAPMMSLMSHGKVPGFAFLAKCFLIGLVLLPLLSFATIELEAPERLVAKEATSLLYIKLIGDEAWTATTDCPVSQDGGWINLRRASGASCDVTVAYKLTANYSTDARVGHIFVNGQTYTIKQLGYGATLAMDSVTIPAIGMASAALLPFVIEPAADGVDIAWTASSDSDWVSVTPSSGRGDGSVAYRVQENTNTEERVARLMVAGCPFVVTQAVAEEREPDDPASKIHLIPEQFTVDSMSRELEIAVLVDDEQIQWPVSTGADWIDVFNEGSGRGNGTIGVILSENESVLPRTGTIAVGAKSMTIVQKGTTNYAVSVSPEVVDIPYSGGQTSVQVHASRDMGWSIQASEPWVNAITPQTGSGDGRVRYVVSPNPTISPRTAEVEVAAAIPYPELDFARGLTQWRGTNWVGQGKMADSCFRDAAVDGHTEGVWFRVTRPNMLHRLFDLNEGTGSLYVTTENRLVFDREDGEIVDLGFSVETNVTYDLFLVTSLTNTLLYGGRHDAGEHRRLYDDAHSLRITSYGRTSKPSEDWLVWGSVSSSAYYWWNRALNKTEMMNIPATAPTIALPNDPVYESVWTYAPCDRFHVYVDGKDEILLSSNTVVSAGREGWGFNGISGLLQINRPIEYRNYWWGYEKYTGKSYDYWDTEQASLFDSPALGQSFLEDYRRSSTAVGHRMGIRVSQLESTYSRKEFSYSFWLKDDVADTLVRDVMCISRCGNLFILGGMSFIPQAQLELGLDAYKLQYSQKGFSFVENGVASPNFGEAEFLKDRWNMITVTSNGQKMTLYVNGIDVGNMLISGYPRFGLNWIAYGHEGKFFFDEIKTFTSCLTTDQVKRIYDLEKPLVFKHVVRQAAATPTLSATHLECGPVGASEVVELTLPSYVQWTVEASADWLVPSVSSGRGSARVTIEVARNLETEGRTGTVTIAGIPVTVEQRAAGIRLTADVLQADPAGDMVAIGIEADDPSTHWVVDMATCPDWILPVDEDGVGSGTLEMDVEEGPHGVIMFSRMGEVTVSGRKFYVVQRDFELLLDKSQITVNSKSQSGTLAVTTEESVGNWDVLTDVDWITLVGAASEYGDGQIDFNLSENTTGKTRQGRIIVAGEVCTVIQNAPAIPARLEIFGPDSVLADSSANYSVKMTFLDGSVEPVAAQVWSTSGNSGATIRDGFLITGPTNGVENVSATVVYDGKSYMASKSVIVLAKPVGLEVSYTPNLLCPGWTVSPGFRVTYADGNQVDVQVKTFQVVRGDATLDEDGFLQLGTQVGEVEVVATYEENGVLVEGRATLTVRSMILPQEALGCSAFEWTFAGDAPWIVDPWVSHDDAFSLRSGGVVAPQASDLVVVTNGSGTLSCWMKASTAEDPEQAAGQIWIDGQLVTTLAGQTDWTNIVHEVADWGMHEIRWRYVKGMDGNDFGRDCIWLDEVVWTPRDASVTNLVIEGPTSVLGGTSVVYRCRAFYDNDTSRIVEANWMLSSGGTRGQIDGATGELSFAQNGGDLIVQALYAEGNESYHAELRVLADPVVLKSTIIGPSTVYMGETAFYTNRIEYAGGRVEYVSSSWTVSSGVISEQGVFSPARPGETTISSLFSNKWQTISQSRKINVLSALMSLEIIGPAVCERGSTAAYKARATFSDGTQEEVSATWSASDGVITGGVFSPSGLGITTVSASYRRGSVVKSATLDVEVYRFLESIEIDGVVDPVKHGEQKTFTCTAHYGDGTEVVVTPIWSASQGTITAQGVYSASSVGRVSISAQYEERGVRKDVTVSFTVERVPTELLISGPDQVVYLRPVAFGCWLMYSDGTRREITTATWTASMGGMSSDGIFRPTGSGSSTVRVEYFVDGKWLSASKTVFVQPAVKKLTIVHEDPLDRSLLVGRRLHFLCWASFSDNTMEYVKPVWSIVDGPAVIDEDGWVTSSAVGGVTIRAEFFDGDKTVSDTFNTWSSDWIALTVTNADSVSTIDPGLVTSVVVKASVGRIPFRMFDSYTNLQHVVVESGVTEIGEAAFTQCRALREVKLGEGIENIKRLAFLNCESLREITIPNSVTNIGDFVWGWSGLTNVVVGSGVKRIDEKAFVGCSKLRNITFLGNAPVGGPNVLDGTPRSLTNWVYRASTGWSTEWPVGDAHARPVAVIDPLVVNGVLSVSRRSDLNGVDTLSVTSLVVKSSFGDIPGWCFCNWSNLVSVVVEPGITNIGKSAFEGNPLLRRVVFGEGVQVLGDTVFKTCDGLEEIVLPGSLLSIGERCFQKCSSLRSVVCLEGLRRIGNGVFLNCSLLKDIVIPNSVTNIGDGAFSWAGLTNVVVGSGVKRIDEKAFVGCSKLRNITFLGNAPVGGPNVLDGTPRSLTNWVYRASTGWSTEWPVGDAYARPVAIIDPAVVNGVLTIGSVSDTNYVDRASVTSVVVKAGLSIVPPEMFRGWPELLSVVIEEGVREIRYAAFGHCPKLRTAEIAQSVTNVEACVFQFCGQLRRADLPSGVDKIENCTFSNCTNLESTVIPDSVKWIGDYAYIECEALRKVFIGSGVTNLGEFAFNNCVNLEMATIGGRVKNLANDVFSGCRRLRDVFFEGNAPTASSNVFAGTPHGLTNWVHQSAVGWLAQWPSNDTNARPVSYVDVVKRTYGVGETLWVSDFSTWGATSTNDVLTLNAGSTIRVRPGAANSSRGWRIPLVLKGGEVVLDLSLYDDETPFWIARSVYSEDGSRLRVKNSRHKRIRLGSPSPMNYNIAFYGSPQLRSDGGFGTVISDGALVFEDCPTVEVWHGIGLYHDLEGCTVVYLKDGTNASTCYPVVLAMGADFYRGQKSIDLLDHVLVLMAQDVAGAGQCLHIGANINLYSSVVATFRVSATDVYLAKAGNPVVKADIALAGGTIYASQRSHEFTGALSGQGTISISGWGGSALLRNSAASTVDLGVVCSQRGTQLRISNSSLFRGSISTFASSTESQVGTYGGSKFGGAQQSYALNYIDAISTDGADSVFAVAQYQLKTEATPTNGAAIKVYSGQTFSIGTLSGTGVHVLDSAGRAGNLVIGTAATSQNWYLPTNVNVTVSNFNPTATGQSIVFDTSHGNNQTVFTIKNANATARTWRMKAISPRMLPRRIEGFTGDLVLGPLPQGDKQTTVTENNWVFPFNSDLADPNVNGCAGSGTLSVPPTGSIRLVFSGTKSLRGGTYPLLTATSGGNALSASAWPVTVEGSVPTGYEIVRDATGVSLRIPTAAAEEVVYENAEGQMLSVAVPHAWLESYPTILSSFDGDFAAAARGRSPGQTGKGKSWDNGKPMYMWQDYLAGTDPLDTNSVFRARIDMVNGVPCLSWTPDLKSTRSYIIYGTPSLVPSSWHSPTNANDRFFKVGVEVK